MLLVPMKDAERRRLGRRSVLVPLGGLRHPIAALVDCQVWQIPEMHFPPVHSDPSAICTSMHPATGSHTA